MDELEKYIVSFLIGFRIRSLRKSKKIAQIDLGKGLVGQSMFSLIENGRILPQPEVLDAIAKRLGDSSLEQYADLIRHPDTTQIDDFLYIHPKEIKRALETFKGKWTYVHSQLVNTLYEYFYTNKLYIEVYQTFNLTMNHKLEIDKDTYAISCFYYGSTLLNQGDFSGALNWLQAAEQSVERLDKSRIGKIFFNLAHACHNMDSSGLALAYARLAADSFNDTTTFALYGRALLLLAITQSRMGLYKLAKKSLLQAQTIIERWEVSTSDKIKLLLSFADVHECLQEFDLAQDYLYKIFEEQPVAENAILICAHRIQCRLFMATGKPEEARFELERSLELSSDAKSMVSHAWSHLLAIDVYEEVVDKIKHAELAYIFAQQTENSLQLALAGQALGQLYTALNQPELANQWTNYSVNHYRTLINRNFSIR